MTALGARHHEASPRNDLLLAVAEENSSCYVTAGVLASWVGSVVRRAL